MATDKEKHDWAKRVLTRHNRWRLGGDGPDTNPIELTEAIDIAIVTLQEKVDQL